MELLCPNCQRKLTIPDDFAGQPAKCPLCNGTFMAPALPTMPALTAQPVAPAPAPPPVETPGTFALVPEEPPPQPMTAPPPVPAPMPAVAPPPVAVTPPAPLEDHTFKLGVTFNPNVLPWITVATVFAVFILTFFTWVGLYPGGTAVRTQSAWQAAFGGQTVDAELEKFAKLPGPKEGDKEKKDDGPGASGLLIVFLLLLIPLLLLTVAAAGTSLVAALPPAVQRFKPWRWGIVAVLALVGFLFLALQVAGNLGIESKARADFDRAHPGSDALKGAESKRLEFERNERLDAVRRTSAMTWAAWLTFIVFLFAAMLFWMERSPHHTPPRVEFRW